MCHMIVADDSVERETLLMRGVLDLGVLALLHRQPLHAYGLVHELVDHGFQQSSYGTVYPLVTRLRRLGLLTQRSEVSPGGPARNVLLLTVEGHAALTRWTRHWHHTVLRVEALLTDGSALPPQEEPHVV